MTIVFDLDYTLLDTTRLKQVMATEGELAALGRCDEFMFPGAIGLLGRLRASGARLILLTFGDDAWQRSKIDRAGIGDLFDEIVTTTDGKHLLLEKFATERPPIIFVNDNLEEIVAMRRAAERFAGCSFIVKRGPKPVAPETIELTWDLPTAETMAQLESLLVFALNR